MDPSFLFFLFLALLAGLATFNDLLSWRHNERRRVVKTRKKREPLLGFLTKGRVEDRKGM